MEVLIPFPTPVMVRPIMNCASGVECACDVTWIMTPMIMMVPPSIIARRRPR